MHFNRKYFICTFLISSILLAVEAQSVKKNPSKPNSKFKRRHYKNYRVVNWCVTGRDEVEFHDWPFAEFVPLLKRNLRYITRDPDNNRYTLKINEIYSRLPWEGAIVNCDGQEDPDFTPNTEDPSARRVPDLPQKGPWCEAVRDCVIDPLTNFCKYGYENIPTTTVTTTTLEPTSTTPANLSAVTSGSTTPSTTTVTTTPTTTTPPTTTPSTTTTTLPPVEFPVPILHDKMTGVPIEIIRYELQPGVWLGPNCPGDIKECRPPNKNASLLKYWGRLFKTVHISIIAEERRRNEKGIFEQWEPQEVEGILIQANHNPEGVGLPHGEFFDEDIECLDCHAFHRTVQIIPCRKRPAFAVAHPTIAAFHHEMRVPQLRSGGSGSLYEMRPAGKKSEIHVNYRWFSPACTETKRLEFTLLIVRSFKNQDFDILRVGPYGTIARGQEYISDFIPTPIFETFFYHKRLQGTFCHSDMSPDITLVTNNTYEPFEMSHNFDKCILNDLNPKPRELGTTSTEILQYSCSKPSHVQCKDSGQGIFDLETNDLEKCPNECPIHTTTPDPPEPEDNRIFKRNLHGGLLTMTNFCIMPVVSFIGRFFKETWNIKQCKGTKAWLMAHIIGSILSCVMIYIGTFHTKVDTNRDSHVLIGKTYILILSITYFTAWGRHKVKWCNLTLEFVHGILGYTTTILAHVTMHRAPDVTQVAKYLVDSQMFIHCGFLVIMSYHIHKFDKMIGMRPRRRHFPTVEARFDSIPLPQARFRTTMLAVLVIITFALSTASLFVK